MSASLVSHAKNETPYGGATSVTVSISTPQAGDLIICACYAEAGADLNTPSGFTILEEFDLMVYYKVSNGTETSVVITPASGTKTYCCIVDVFRTIDTTPAEIEHANSGAPSTTYTSDTKSSVATGGLCVAYSGVNQLVDSLTFLCTGITGTGWSSTGNNSSVGSGAPTTNQAVAIKGAYNNSSTGTVTGATFTWNDSSFPVAYGSSFKFAPPNSAVIQNSLMQSL